jgi:hypothetical protein
MSHDALRDIAGRRAGNRARGYGIGLHPHPSKAQAGRCGIRKHVRARGSAELFGQCCSGASGAKRATVVSATMERAEIPSARSGFRKEVFVKLLSPFDPACATRLQDRGSGSSIIDVLAQELDDFREITALQHHPVLGVVEDFDVVAELHYRRAAKLDCQRALQGLSALRAFDQLTTMTSLRPKTLIALLDQGARFVYRTAQWISDWHFSGIPKFDLLQLASDKTARAIARYNRREPATRSRSRLQTVSRACFEPQS